MTWRSGSPWRRPSWAGRGSRSRMPLLACMPLKVLVHLFVSSHCAAGHRDSALHSHVIMQAAHDCNINTHVSALPAGSGKRTRTHKTRAR